MDNKKERKKWRRRYMHLTEYLLHHIKSPERHERILHFVQNEAMDEMRGRRAADRALQKQLPQGIG